MITVRDGFGFLRCEERDEKDQLFFHFRELPDNMHLSLIHISEPTRPY